MIPLELSLKRVYQGVHMRASKSLSYVIDEASAEAVSGRKKIYIAGTYIYWDSQIDRENGLRHYKRS